MDIIKHIKTLRTLDDVKKEKPFTCRICGKSDKNVQLLCGGIVGYAHENCTKNLDRIIDVFLEYCVTADNGTVFLAEELIKAQKRVYERSESMTRGDNDG